MSSRPDAASTFWIYWQLPNGRSGKLGPFRRSVTASPAADLVVRKEAQPVASEQRLPESLDLTRRRLYYGETPTRPHDGQNDRLP
jgi:hypothetical protein